MKKRPVKSTNRLVTQKKRRRALDPATRQLLFQIATGVGIFTILVLIVTGVWYGSRVSALTLNTITVEGGQTISHTDVRETVARTLEGNYFGLVPKRFAWSYSHESALAAVSAISRVKNPEIERVSGTELRVEIDEYLPFALWCKINSETECLFIDEAGVAFAPAPMLDGGTLYRFYIIGAEPVMFETLRDAATLARIVVIAEALETNFALPVTKIELDTVGDVFLKVVRGGEIKVTTKQSPEETLENLALVLSADDFKDLEAGTFQYIDLRFGSKVFVNDTIPVVATTTADTSTIMRVDDHDADNTLEAIVREVAEVVRITPEEDDEGIVRSEDNDDTNTTMLSTATSSLIEQ